MPVPTGISPVDDRVDAVIPGQRQNRGGQWPRHEQSHRCGGERGGAELDAGVGSVKAGGRGQSGRAGGGAGIDAAVSVTPAEFSQQESMSTRASPPWMRVSMLALTSAADRWDVEPTPPLIRASLPWMRVSMLALTWVADRWTSRLTWPSIQASPRWMPASMPGGLGSGTVDVGADPSIDLGVVVVSTPPLMSVAALSTPGSTSIWHRG